MTSASKSSPSSGCHDFHKTLNDFRESCTLTDVTIYGDDEIPLHAHSVVLAAGSDVLRSTLTLKRSNDILIKQGISMSVEGISSHTWKLVLDFLYLRSLSVKLSDLELSKLFVAAKILGIKNLALSLENFISNLNLDVDSDADTKAVKIKLTRKDICVSSDDEEEFDGEYSGIDQFLMKNEDSTDEHYQTPLKKIKGKSHRTLPLKCLNSQCSLTFDKAQARYEHYFSCILSDSSYNVLEYVKELDDGRILYTDPFMVPDEPEAMTEAFATKIGHKEGVYQCDQCETEDNYNRMVLHLAHVHCLRKPYRCRLCEHRWYKYFKTFTDHYKAEHESQYHQCKFCGRQFRNAKSLFRHKITEHDYGEAKHECSVCGKKFKDQRHARRHEVYHQSEEERRVHPCPVCSKKFMSIADLRKHVLIHSDEKPYQCSVCGYRTSIRTSLVKHERTHGIITANYVCITCERYYLSEFAFKNHLQKDSHEGKNITDLSQDELSSLTNFTKVSDDVDGFEDQPMIADSDSQVLEAITPDQQESLQSIVFLEKQPF